MIKKLLEKYKNNKRLRQVVILYLANILGIPLLIVSSIIVTRFLGPTSYGDYKFLTSLFNLIIVIFTFGFFQAGNRALVLNNSPEKARELFGAELAILLVIFMFMAMFLMGYAFFDNNINEKGLHGMLILLIPFSWIFLMNRYCETLFQADNKINLLAVYRLFPRFLYCLFVVLLYYFFSEYTENKLELIWFLYISAEIVMLLYVFFKVNPSFKNLRKNINLIWSYNKSYGLNVYLGTLFGVGCAQLTGVLISYFSNDNSGVGYYSLAITITLPLSFIPNVISTTHYKDFSVATRIPRRLFIITILLSVAALIMLWFLVGPFIRIFYGNQFAPVISLTMIVSIGVALYGLADFFNRFLGSHGRGKELRNSSIIVGLSLLVCNFILVPLFGEKGAAYTKVITGIVYVISMYWFYRKELTKTRP